MARRNGTALVAPAPDDEPSKPERGGETASSAIASQARAAVEARYLVALKNPRNLNQVRVKILEACKRPRFAEKARYAKPVGQRDPVVGPSIRFAEEVLRLFGNVYVERMVVYDDDTKRIVRITLTDLEANLSYPMDAVMDKTVERQYVPKGRTVVSSRENSQGKMTYLIEATEEEMVVKEAAWTSKLIRAGTLRLLPSDILEEAMEQVTATLKAEDAADPKQRVKKIVDAFYDIGVDPKEIVEYLGHAIETCSPAEINRLRLVYQAIDQGETTWSEVREVEKLNRDGLEAKRSERAEQQEAGAGKSGLAARVAERAARVTGGGKGRNASNAHAARMTQLQNERTMGHPLSEDELEELRQWEMDTGAKV